MIMQNPGTGLDNATFDVQAGSLIGATNSSEAAPGTIRGDMGISFSHNMVHGSDSAEAAKTELALFFAEDGDICEWTPINHVWVYNVEEELS